MERLSQGHFLKSSIVPASNKRKRAGNGRAKKAIMRRNFSNIKFPALMHGQEPEKATEMRLSKFRAYWEECEQVIAEVLETANKEVFEKICSSVIKSCAKSSLFDSLPTLILSTGINVQDFKEQYNLLVRMLNGSGCEVISIEKEHSHSSVSSTIKSINKFIVSKVVKDCVIAERYLDHDIEALRKYYVANDLYDSSQPLVVFIPELEQFEKLAVECLVSMLHDIQTDVPIVLILGCATSTDTMLADLFTSSSLSMLRYERFNIHYDYRCLEQILEQLFIDNRSILKLTAKQLDYLVSKFCDIDYSIAAFKQSLRYCYMCSFYSEPLIVLCDTWRDSTKIKQAMELLNKEHMEELRSLPSFKRRIEIMVNENPREAILLLENDFYFFDKLEPWLEDLNMDMEKFSFGFNCLSSLVSQIKTKTFKKTRTELFINVQEPNFLRSDYIEHMYRLMKLMLPEKFILFIDSCIRHSQKLIDGDLANPDTLIDIEFYENANRQFKSFKQTFENEDFGSLEAVTGAYKSFLQDVQEYVELLLNASLDISTILFHEILYMSHIKKLRKAFSPQPLASIDAALRNPGHYLGDSCGYISSRSQDIPSTFEDLSISYCLFTEMGKLINLHDWYQSFSQITNENPEDEKCLARFLRTILELQYMGFIKNTTRKVDHVQRMVWGL